MVRSLGCFLVACVAGNLVGTLHEEAIKQYYHQLEKKAVKVQDLYYLGQINRKLAIFIISILFFF